MRFTWQTNRQSNNGIPIDHCWMGVSQGIVASYKTKYFTNSISLTFMETVQIGIKTKPSIKLSTCQCNIWHKLCTLSQYTYYMHRSNSKLKSCYKLQNSREFFSKQLREWKSTFYTGNAIKHRDSCSCKHTGSDKVNHTTCRSALWFKCVKTRFYSSWTPTFFMSIK